MPISNETLAYIAGFLDGEGSIMILKYTNPTNPTYFPVISIYNTNEEVIKWLGDNLNGNVSCWASKEPNRRPAWRWRAGGASAIFYLQMLLPFLIVKRRQAELAIEFYVEKAHRVSGTYLTQKELDRGEWYKQEISKLSLKKGAQEL